MEEIKEEKPDMEFLARFIPVQDMAALKETYKDRPWLYDITLSIMESRIKQMPPLENRKDCDDPVWLRYYSLPWGTHYWLTNLDQETGIGFGYWVKNFDWTNAGEGEISIQEIISPYVDEESLCIDFDWGSEITREDIVRLIENHRNETNNGKCMISLAKRRRDQI